MIINWGSLITLLPVLIISTTIIIMMLSVSYRRDQFKHALLTIIGLILAGIASFRRLWDDSSGVCGISKLIYVDDSTVLYIILVIIASLSSSISVYTWLLHYPTNRRDEFYLLLLLSSMGAILLIMADHLIMLFLGIELISIPLIGLIGYAYFQKNSIESSIKYIILSGISSSFFLFGISFIYAETGYLSFSEIKEILCSVSQNDYFIISLQSIGFIVIGLAMIMVGFAFKLSFVPFHLWTPDVYQSSSSSVSMYLTTASKIAVTSVLVRFLLILPSQYHKMFYMFLSGSACCSMLFGSIMMIQQNSMKRILAYSSITNSGYLLVVLITTYINYSIMQEVIGIYLIGYLFSNIGAFGIINIISTCCMKKDCDAILLYRGLFWREPALSIIFTIIMLSLAGIPMTLGFIGKFYLLLVGISNQLWFLTIVMLISSIISIFFYLKIIMNLYLSPVDHNNSDLGDYHLNNWFCTAEGIMVIISTIIILMFGLYPQPLINLIYFICTNTYG